MVNWYVVAYYDKSNKLRLSPKRIHVHPGDNVIWASNIDEQYMAGKFSSAKLFPQPSYDMPANNLSSPATVQDVPPAKYDYKCTGSKGARAVAGDSVPGIIIVDPPGEPNPKGKGHQQQAAASKKRGR